LNEIAWVGLKSRLLEDAEPGSFQSLRYRVVE
jgi:hypothetical protein